MSKIKQYSAAEKLAILQELETAQATILEIAEKYERSRTTLINWRHRYELYGCKGLENRTYHQSYSADLKIHAVQDYLSGKGSQRQIIDKYEMASCKQLWEWIRKYNSHSKFKTNEGGRVRAMTKGRSTTYRERIDIVLYCLAHNHDYSSTSQHFQVSYTQIYQWVKKYEADGEDALKDGRGRKRDIVELSEPDKQRLALKKLETENERLRAENALLKKLQELERRRF